MHWEGCLVIRVQLRLLCTIAPTQTMRKVRELNVKPALASGFTERKPFASEEANGKG